ncbi:MAG TPA: hypothetical protein VIU43_01205 [Nitrosospira sp.]
MVIEPGCRGGSRRGGVGIRHQRHVLRVAIEESIDGRRIHENAGRMLLAGAIRGVGQLDGFPLPDAVPVIVVQGSLNLDTARKLNVRSGDIIALGLVLILDLPGELREVPNISYRADRLILVRAGVHVEENGHHIGQLIVAVIEEPGNSPVN